MKGRLRTTGLTILALGLVLTSTSARANGFVPQCCACVGPHRVVSNGDSATQAIFCQEALNSDQLTGIENRCNVLDGAALCLPVEAPCAGLDAEPGCVQTDDLGSASQASQPVDCKALLLEEVAIACPSSQAAPVFGPGALAGLAFGLAGLGVWAVRRRGSARLPR